MVSMRASTSSSSALNAFAGVLRPGPSAQILQTTARPPHCLTALPDLEAQVLALGGRGPLQEVALRHAEAPEDVRVLVGDGLLRRVVRHRPCRRR